MMKVEHGAIQQYTLLEDDWTHVNEIIEFLKIPAIITKQMSVAKYPTLNLIINATNLIVDHCNKFIEKYPVVSMEVHENNHVLDIAGIRSSNKPKSKKKQTVILSSIDSQRNTNIAIGDAPLFHQCAMKLKEKVLEYKEKINTEPAILATMLDPRNIKKQLTSNPPKSVYHLVENSYDLVKEVVERDFSEFLSDDRLMDFNNNNEIEEISNNNNVTMTQQNIEESNGNEFDEVVLEYYENNEPNLLFDKNCIIKAQLFSYVSMVNNTQITKNFNLIEFVSNLIHSNDHDGNKSMDIMFNLCGKIFSIPPTTVSTERANKSAR